METLSRLIKWLFRAWPCLVFIPIIWAHYALVSYFPQCAIQTNKTISLISQILGGLLVLYSVDSNIGVIKNKSLFVLLAEYFKAFPLVKRSVSISVHGLSTTSSMGSANLTVKQLPKTIDEKLEYLQEQITDLERTVTTKTAEIHEKISAQSQEITQRYNETTSALNLLESKIDAVTTGGLKVQLFGVLLLIYGAVTSYVA